ncbi:MAG: T9SS type A sorting domain-containing protein [Bacteroidetes bacterium]|nr:T9SS type A sorting domain-containing protein [Bacteroidota bacterium]
MKKIYSFVILSVLFFSLSIKSSAQSSANTLDVVSWNLEWFGYPANGPSDADLQESNVKTVIRYLDADIYGLCEVVDTMRFRRLVDSLGSAEYGYYISPFCSNNTTGTGNGWLTGQKLGFIYKKNLFSNIHVRGIMRSSSSAYTNWASGRFPYLFSADVTINSITRNVNFFVIHGKSGSTSSDYDKRLAASTEFKDTLDAEFSNSINFIIGDYNDALNQTISTGSGPQSSYQPIVIDSTDNDHYKSVTIPLAYLGQASMIDYPNVIDNHIISNEGEPYYIAGSAQIRTDVTSVVSNYLSNNTSDHYPVFSQYNLTGVVTSVSDVPSNILQVSAYPNPFTNSIFLKTGKPLSKVHIQLTDITGRILYTQYFKALNADNTTTINVPLLQRGAYLLIIQTPGYRTILKMIHN